VGEGVPGARAALPRQLPAQYSASAGGGHDRVRDGTGWIAAAFAHARHPPTHRRAERSGLRTEGDHPVLSPPSSVLSPCLSHSSDASDTDRKALTPTRGDVGHPHAPHAETLRSV